MERREKYITSMDQLKKIDQRVTVRYRAKVNFPDASDGSFNAYSTNAIKIIALLEKSGHYVRDIWYLDDCKETPKISGNLLNMC